MSASGLPVREMEEIALDSDYLNVSQISRSCDGLLYQKIIEKKQKGSVYEILENLDNTCVGSVDVDYCTAEYGSRGNTDTLFHHRAAPGIAVVPDAPDWLSPRIIRFCLPATAVGEWCERLRIIGSLGRRRSNNDTLHFSRASGSTEWLVYPRKP